MFSAREFQKGTATKRFREINKTRNKFDGTSSRMTKQNFKKDIHLSA